MSNYRMELHGWEAYRCIEAVRLFNQARFDKSIDVQTLDSWLSARLYHHMLRVAARRKAQDEIRRARNMEN
jgi:hypothetical protein